MVKRHKIPTIIGLILLVLGVAAGVFLVQRAQPFSLRASPEQTPQQIRITNITDKSFSVSWITDQATLGFLSYGKSASLGGTANDEISSNNPSLIHHVTVSGLSPNTSYFFKVGADKNLFDNDGQPYKATTAPQITIALKTDIIFGTVDTATGSPAANVLVYVTLSGISPLSAVTDNSGKWSIPLSTARSTNLSSRASYTPEDKLQIFVQGGAGSFASATIAVGAAHPVPPIILGQTHDFSDIKPVGTSDLPSSNVTVPEEAPQASPSSGFNLEGTGSRESSIKVSLSNPDDGERVSATKPQFAGTGTPGTKFTITVESEVITEQATVGSNGSWSWTPPENLEPGEHTVTISWKDEAGQTRILKRSFTVLAAGESDLPSFTASPSGQVASPSPSPSPSPRTSIPSTEGGVPTSGNLTTTLGIFIMGIVLLLTGLLLPKVLKY